MNTAAIIVDFQNDFLPTGALGVEGGHYATFPLMKMADEADVIVFTRDWHPADHSSFAQGIPEYRDGSWPPHCVQGTEGAEIDDMLWEYVISLGKPVILVHKGDEQDKEAYSGFQGHVVDVFNDEKLKEALLDEKCSTTLAQALHYLDVRSVKVGGLALDYCVKATAIDSRAHFGNTTVYLDATRPVAYLTGAAAVRDLVAAGVAISDRNFL